jgi:alkylhydroperoxidase family enzyme
MHPFLAAGAASPELLDWWQESFRRTVLDGGRAPQRVKELLVAHVAQASGVEFPGLTGPADPGAPVSEAERAVLELADEMALRNMSGYLDEELYGRLAAHYDDGAIFELGMTMAVLCGFARFQRVYGLEGHRES